MNAEQRELLRVSILGALQKCGKYTPTLETLAMGLRRSGVRADLDDVQAETQYLIDKGFAQETAKALSPENKQYRITAAGRDFLAVEGLA